MSPELLLQHFNRISEAPDAIARLRRFILDLAVRGKLVEQDPSDEPATELLKRIQAEKARLVKEGKIKKEKPLLLHDNYKASFQMPANWVLSMLDSVSALITDGEHLSPNKTQSGMFLLTAKHVLDDGVTLNDPQYVAYEDGLKFRKRCAPQFGDLLICSRGTIGRCCVMTLDAVFCLMGSVILVRPLTDLVPQYLDYYLKSEMGQLFIRGVTKGMAVNALYLKDIRLCPIPLPPLAEQQRIVAKVDELMALCDQLEAERNQREAHRDKLVAASLNRISSTTAEEAKDAARFHLNLLPRLTTKPEHVKQLRQTILNLAVRGKLVEQDPNDEPATELLKRIQAEKERLVKEGKIKMLGPLPDFVEAQRPYQCPPEWQWVRLGHLIEDADAGWSPKTEGFPRSGESWGVLKVSAVSWDKFNPEENKQLLPGVVAPSSAVVHKDDFLISRANTSELVAKCVVVEQEPQNLILSDKIVRLRLTSNCDKKYLCIVNNSANYARTYYSEEASGTSLSMKNVSRQVIYSLPIPLPPLAEQQRIVAKVDQLMGLCDQLEAQLATTTADSRRLLEAVLHDALKTGLVAA